MVRNKDLDPKLIDQLNQHYTVDPQPGFLSTLKTNLMNQPQGGSQSRRKPNRLAVALIGAFAVLTLIFFATPVGNAIGQQFVELFHKAESNVLPYPPAQTAIAGYTATAALGPTNTPDASATKTPEVTRTPDPASKFDAHMTVDEVEQAAGFDVLAPSALASNFVYHGGSEQNISLLFYDLIGYGTNGLVISQEPITGMDDCDLCSDIGPAAHVHDVTIGDASGQYVTGVWFLQDGNREWANDPWLKRLRWQTGDTVFEILFMGPPMTMRKSDLVNLAESMVSENPKPTPTPTVTPIGAAKTPDPSEKENAHMTIEEVKQAAGFDVLVPTYLADFKFYGANYDPNTKIAYLFYEDGMLIRQEQTSGIEDCDLCAEVRIGASYRNVQVGEVEGEYAYGIWSFTGQDNVTTTVPQPKRLRWQINDVLFEILYDHDPSELSIGELVTIAESFQ